MLLETLKLLVHAGEDALMTACQLPVTGVSVNQLRQGQITFPALATLGFQGGTLKEVRLGGDSRLCRYLAELPPTEPSSSGFQHLASRFLTQALLEMEGRRPRGQIEDLQVGPRTVYTRGTRSFGFKFSTTSGQMFLLAEVPSRIELEQAKGSEFLAGMISTYLPPNWSGRPALPGRTEIDSFLVFLRKTEGDVFVEIPAGTERCETRSGVLLEQCTHEGRRALRVNLDLEHGPGADLEVGQSLVAFVGVQDRSLEMDLTYLGSEPFTLVGGASLDTALFALPESVRIVQRRRAFRIDLLSNVPVEVEAIDEDCTTALWFGDEEIGTGAMGRLLDLSFSGTRVVGEAGELCPAFPEGTRVRCRIFFPDEPHPVQVLGLVRRSSSKLVDRDTYQDELGVEFLVSPEVDRHSLDIIRQYVLKEQRVILARRVQLAGHL